MEDLGLRALYRRVAGIDVHRMLHVITVLIEQPDGSMQRHSREFGGFRRDCQALAAWLGELGVELVVMESTGIYWKSVHAHVENAGIAAWVVNAHTIKHVPAHRGGTQDDPTDLHPAESTTGQPRLSHRLRRDEREQERAALDQATQDHRPLTVVQTRRCQRLIRR